MLLTPKRWKFRKQFRGRLKGASSTWNYVSFGDFWMKATESAYITNRQIESARKVIVRYTRKVWKIWIRIFPDLPYTKKGLEMPMGKWKWDVSMYRARVKRGRVLFEVNGLNKETASKAFKLATYKLPLRTRLVEKWEIN